MLKPKFDIDQKVLHNGVVRMVYSASINKHTVTYTFHDPGPTALETELQPMPIFVKGEFVVVTQPGHPDHGKVGDVVSVNNGEVIVDTGECKNYKPKELTSLGNYTHIRLPISLVIRISSKLGPPDKYLFDACANYSRHKQ